MTSLPTLEELRALPKLELHAHLNGCVRLSHLTDLVEDPSQLPQLPPPNSPPSHYFDFMSKISQITCTPGNLRLALERVLRDFEDDGVVYLELRSSPKSSHHMTKTQYVDTIINVMAEYSGEMIVRYLISIDQSKSLSEMMENADLAIKYSKSSPIVVGVDLCGNFFSTTKKNTMQVLQVCRAAGLRIACHIAEDQATCDQTSDVIRDISPDRLGHATLIDTESDDGLLVRERELIIECCITSNLICKSVDKPENHHFKKWLDLKHPVILCTDDSGTFDTSLTKEYLMAARTFSLTTNDLLSMNLNAVRWIFDDEAKDKLRIILNSALGFSINCE